MGMIGDGVESSSREELKQFYQMSLFGFSPRCRGLVGVACFA